MFNSRTRLIIINTPNNPIGKVCSNVKILFSPRPFLFKGLHSWRTWTYREFMSKAQRDLHIGWSLWMDHLRSKQETYPYSNITQYVGTNSDDRKCGKNIFINWFETRMDNRAETSHSVLSNCSSSKLITKDFHWMDKENCFRIVFIRVQLFLKKWLLVVSNMNLSV